MEAKHSGGNTDFWQGKEVEQYNYRQSMSVEQKEIALNNIVKIVDYFIKKNKIAKPNILDIGCGQGALLFRILDEIPVCNIVGVDASEDMLSMARKQTDRVKVFCCNFNDENFWTPEIDKNYDIIISSLALHFLSDERMKLFFEEIREHLNENGILVIYLASCSDINEIEEMEQSFRIQFVFSNSSEEQRNVGFEKFKEQYIANDSILNINWKSPSCYIEALREIGFIKSDIVWQLWTFSIILAINIEGEINV